MQSLEYAGEKEVSAFLENYTNAVTAENILYVYGDLFLFQNPTLRAAWVTFTQVLVQKNVDFKALYPHDSEETIRRALHSIELHLRFQPLIQPLAWFIDSDTVYHIGMDPEPFIIAISQEHQWRYYEHYFLSEWYKNRPLQAVTEVLQRFAMPIQNLPETIFDQTTDASILAQITDLEKVDNSWVDEDGIQTQVKYWSVPSTTAQVLTYFSIGSNAKNILEIGSGGGYSTLHLAKAAQKTGGNIITIERHPRKSEKVVQVLRDANITNVTSLWGDAQKLVPTIELPLLDLVFLDADRKYYPLYFELLLPKMKAGSFIVVDNAFDYGADMHEYVEIITARGLNTYLLHVDNGLLISQIPKP